MKKSVKFLKSMLLVLMFVTVSSLGVYAEPTNSPEFDIDTNSLVGGYVPTESDFGAPSIHGNKNQTDNPVLYSAIPGPNIEYYNPLEGEYKKDVFPILKDQSPFGTCWAFSSIGISELSILAKHEFSKEYLYDFSESHLAYHSYNSVDNFMKTTTEDKIDYVDKELSDYEKLLGENTYLENGGNYTYAAYTLLDWKGLSDEKLYPYANALDATFSQTDSFNDIAHLQNVYKVNLDSDRDEAKKLIINYGGLGVSICYADQFYDKSNNSFYCGTAYTTNHAVTIVGWDDNFSKSKFTSNGSSISDDGAWLIRNSWNNSASPVYDRYSYFWLSYYDLSLSDTGFAFDVYLPGEEQYFDNNYYYDGGLDDRFTWYDEKTTLASNVFSAQGNESLQSVGFATEDENVNYKISIYKLNSTFKNPAEGTLLATKSGTTSFAGFHTVNLDSSVSLSEGDIFSVVIEFPAKTKLVLERNNDQKGFTVSAPSRTSFFGYKDGSYSIWNDNSTNNYGNIRIKAYTNNLNNIEHLIIYNLDGGTNSNLNPSKYREGVGVPTLSNPFKTGYTFEGWYRDSKFENKVTGILASESEDITLYAKWSANKYKISFNLNQGAWSNSYVPPTEYTYGVGLASLPAPVRDKFEFVGWYIDNKFENRIESIPSDSTAEYTLYAKWNQVIFNISYDCGIGSKDPSKVYPSTYDSRVGVDFFESPIIYASTMIFDGWYLDSEYNTKVTSIPVGTTGFICLHAKWVDKEKHSITYVLNGGANSNLNPSTYYYGEGVSSFADASRNGYKFEGWYSDNAFLNRVTSVSTTDKSDVTLYAKWSVNKYSITFNLNDGSWESGYVAPTEYSFDTGMTDIPTPVRERYAFEGWYLEEQLVNRIESIPQYSTSAYTLYAKWKLVVSQTDLSDCTIILEKDVYTYDGSSITPSVRVLNGNIEYGKDRYSVVYENNINAGTGKVTITAVGDDNPIKGSVIKFFTINKAANTISVKASSITKETSSKVLKINLGASAPSGKLSYKSNNSKVKVDASGNVSIPKNFVGLVKITLTAGNDNYVSSSATVSITVNPKGTSISKLKSSASGKLTVTWKKNTSVSGYEISYSTDKSFSAKKTKKVTVKSAKTASKTLTKLSKGKKYYVRIRTYKTVSGKKYYSSQSKVKNVKIKK